MRNVHLLMFHVAHKGGSPMIHRGSVKKNQCHLVILMVLTFHVFLCTSAYGQVAGATLSGTVTDPSGASISGAQVAITNAATGVVRKVTTNGAGFYSAPNLLPGTYGVAVSNEG